jgi:hypothetical protein
MNIYIQLMNNPLKVESGDKMEFEYKQVQLKARNETKNYHPLDLNCKKSTRSLSTLT